jgi:hypothetical protein
MFTWALILALCVMVGICMHLLAGRSGLLQRVADAQAVIADLYAARGEGPATVRACSRLRMYCAQWGMVMTRDNIEPKGDA